MPRQKRLPAKLVPLVTLLAVYATIAISLMVIRPAPAYSDLKTTKATLIKAEKIERSRRGCRLRMWLDDGSAWKYTCFPGSDQVVSMQGMPITIRHIQRFNLPPWGSPEIWEIILNGQNIYPYERKVAYQPNNQITGTIVLAVLWLMYFLLLRSLKPRDKN